MPRVDREGPIHRAVLAFVRAALPRAVVHHSPNEVARRGKAGMLNAQRQRSLGTVTGWPDLEVIISGRVYFLEVKAPDGRQTEAQREVQAMLAAQGAPYALVRSVDDARSALLSWGLIR